MPYVIATSLNYRQLYYMADCPDENYFHEVYDPRFATTFETQKAANIWAKENTDFEDRIKIVKLEEAIAEYDKWVNEGTIRAKVLKINSEYSRKYSGESSEDVLDWWFHYKSSPDITVRYEDYKTWPHLYERFKHLWDVVYCRDKSVTVTLYTSSKGKLEDFIQELDLVKGRVTHIVDGDLVFPVMDHYCGINGNFVHFRYNPKTGKASVKDSYNYDLIMDGNLAGAFEYLRRERYYELN